MVSSPVSFLYRLGCECGPCNGMTCSLTWAPTAYLVQRNGNAICLCTRCLRDSDRIVEILADENAPYDFFSQYDPAGAIELVAKLVVRALGSHISYLRLLVNGPV